MAQILKKETRERIIEAAKEEFLSCGFKDASMRRIAQKSEMTVGNLYRYFTSKDAINEWIVGPTMNEINQLVMSLTMNNVSFESTEFKIDYSIEQIKQLLSTIIDKVGTIAYKRKIEFKILLMSSKLTKSTTEWLKSLVKYIIVKNYGLENNENVDIISGCYAVAIVEGFKQILDGCKDEETFKALAKAYMFSYVSMMENDIGKYMVE